MKYSILEIFDTETGERREICRTDEHINAPFFHSDNELCYNAGGLIYRIRLDSGETCVTPTGSCTHSNNDHLFSPGGRYLAISDEVPGLGSKIWLIDLQGESEPRLLTPDTICYLHGYSPDGKALLYTSKRNDTCDIYSLSIDGLEETRLTFGEGHNDGAEYSPDGRYIYFNSTRGGLMDCYRMDADGKIPVRLTGNGRNNWFPHISPDGTAVVYLSYSAEVQPYKHPPDKNVQLRMMNPDGTGDRCLLKLYGGQGTLNVNSWMPGGRYFAFVRYE